MPRRRKDPTAEILEDVVDTAVDAVFDKAGRVFRQLRDRQQQGMSPETLASTFTCAACRKEFPLQGVEMMHPSNGFALCKGCFDFLWKAGAEKLKAFGQRAAKQQAARQQAGGASQQQRPAAAPPPQGKTPWDVLGVAQNASLDEIKKAYRKQAMLWHPDRVPAGASSDEKMRAKMMFDEVQRSYKVMVSVRSAPEAP